MHAYMDTIISSLRAVVDALVQSQDGRTCVYQMEAFMLATELAYRELLIKEHVDGLSTSEEIAKELTRSALQKFRVAFDRKKR